MDDHKPRQRAPLWRRACGLLPKHTRWYSSQPTGTFGARSPRTYHGLAGLLRPQSVFHLSVLTGWTLLDQTSKTWPALSATFTTHEVRAAKRRKDYLAHQDHSHNLRSAVEATVRSLKHPFLAGKLPVRGKFRVTCMAITPAATTKVRRIQRYQIAKMKQAEAAISLQRDAGPVPLVSFFAFSARWLRSRLVFSPSFGC